MTEALHMGMRITDEEFLRVLFGEHWGSAHVAHFPDDPHNISDARRAACWAGGFADVELPKFAEGENTYYTISQFAPEGSGRGERAVRRKSNFIECSVIVADDVNEKIPVELAELLPAPTYKLLTSAGSEQWGWKLSEPCADQGRVAALLDGLVRHGLAPDGRDPGMRGVTRYVRLPSGWNTKASRLVDGAAFKCELLEWSPGVSVELEDLAAVFSIDLRATSSPGDHAGLSIDDPVVRDHPVMAHVELVAGGGEGWIGVVCPNVAEHSGGDISGSAMRISPDGAIYYECHHGHCNSDERNITGSVFLEMLDEQKCGGSGELIQAVNTYKAELRVAGMAALGEALARLGEVRAIDTGGEVGGAGGGARGRTFFDFCYIPKDNAFYEWRTGHMIGVSAFNHLFPAGEDGSASGAFVRGAVCGETMADAVGWSPQGIVPLVGDDRFFMDGGKVYVNTWPGLALTARGGDCSLWLSHLAYLVPDERERDAVLDYLAYLVQFPERKPAYFLAHAGTPGVGKDLLYKPIMQIFGTRSAGEVSTSDLLGWGDYVEAKKFLIITEADAGRDRTVSNQMKVITAGTAGGLQKINMKGGQVRHQRNVCGGVIMSNRQGFLAIDDNERRYFVVNSYIPPRDGAYYRVLSDWYAEGGAGVVLGCLLARPLPVGCCEALPFVSKATAALREAGRYDYEVHLSEMIDDREPPFHKKVVPVKAFRKAIKDAGIAGGLTGLHEAMERLGYKKARGQIKREGKVLSTPTFYGHEMPNDLTTGEVFEWWEQEKDADLEG